MKVLTGQFAYTRATVLASRGGHMATRSSIALLALSLVTTACKDGDESDLACDGETEETDMTGVPPTETDEVETPPVDPATRTECAFLHWPYPTGLQVEVTAEPEIRILYDDGWLNMNQPPAVTATVASRYGCGEVLLTGFVISIIHRGHNGAWVNEVEEMLLNPHDADTGTPLEMSDVESFITLENGRVIGPRSTPYFETAPRLNSTDVFYGEVRYTWELEEDNYISTGADGFDKKSLTFTIPILELIPETIYREVVVTVGGQQVQGVIMESLDGDSLSISIRPRFMLPGQSEMFWPQDGTATDVGSYRMVF